ncbi:MAG: hypothetical protein ACJA0Q_001701 [Saprospiraceae bacterium]|jgi:hypothetical protein
MMSELRKENNVIEISSEKDFYSVINQLVKDFNDEVFEERVHMLTPGNKTELIEEVNLFLSEVCNRSITNFSQLMYLVDMPENILAPFLLDGERCWEEFSYQVIKREYLKVLIRKKHSA